MNTLIEKALRGAHTPVIVVETNDHRRVVTEVSRKLRDLNKASGNLYRVREIYPDGDEIRDFIEQLQMGSLSEHTVLVEAHGLLEGQVPSFIRYIDDYKPDQPKIIFVSSAPRVPHPLSNYIPVFADHAPDERTAYEFGIENYIPGLTIPEMHLARDLGEKFVVDLFIKRSDGILSFVRPPKFKLFGLDDVYNALVRLSRVSTTRGALLVGVPGCGKSSVAYRLAENDEAVVLLLNVGAIYGSLVGESERRMRMVLNLVLTIAEYKRVILIVDEGEKAFSRSAGSGSDSGVTDRIFGQFLSFMEDANNVFVVATMNNPMLVPTELLRRFTVTISFTFPPEGIRREIAEYYQSFYNIKIPQPILRQVTSPNALVTPDDIRRLAEVLAAGLPPDRYWKPLIQIDRRAKEISEFVRRIGSPAWPELN